MRSCLRGSRVSSASTAAPPPLSGNAACVTLMMAASGILRLSGGWTIITKDEDFVARCITSRDAPPVVWLGIGNCTNDVLFTWLEPLFGNVKERLTLGARVIDVR